MYTIENNCFVCRNGNGRYNRPLYGQYGTFITYAGDRPEWALSRPGKTGNLLVGITKGKKGKWLIDADTVVASYCPGVYTHEISDRLLGKQKLVIRSVAMRDADGLVLDISLTGPVKGLQVVWAFGGINDLSDPYCTPEYDVNGYDHESHFFPNPEDSRDNHVTIDSRGFRMTADFAIDCRDNSAHPQPDDVHNRKPHYGISGASTTGGHSFVADSSAFAKIANLHSKRVVHPVAVESYEPDDQPALIGVRMMRNGSDRLTRGELKKRFSYALANHEAVRNRVTVSTPDADLNAIVPALNASADALWHAPYIMHGGIHCHGCYMGWRSPYAPTALGPWERAESHFNTFAKTQKKDSKGTTRGGMQMSVDVEYSRVRRDSILFSKGRMENQDYNMQEGFIDQVIRHCLYTGDDKFLKKMFPVIKRHLEWEKRCFDTDNDGLYENFANTHISDAHGYYGAGCAQASAYTHFANMFMARAAKKLGKSPKPFLAEARKIRNALNRKLWMPTDGAYGECLDTIGNKLLHDNPELPSIYHIIDSEVADDLQAWQMLHYVRHTYEHVTCGDDQGELVWSCNWVPWSWSIRQLMPNETCHLALSAWQAGCYQQGYRYFIGPLIDSMKESKTPGHVIATSPRDLHNPMLGTDFGCGIGTAARALIEGLFGLRLNHVDGEAVIAPGFPDDWDHASITTPYATLEYAKDKKRRTLRGTLHKAATVIVQLPYTHDALPSVTVNEHKVTPELICGVAAPTVQVRIPATDAFECVVTTVGKQLRPVPCPTRVVPGQKIALVRDGTNVLEIEDSQGCLSRHTKKQAVIGKRLGHYCFFVKLRQNDSVWWQAFEIEIQPATEILNPTFCKHTGKVYCELRNNVSGTTRSHSLQPEFDATVPGTYTITTKTAHAEVGVWDLPEPPALDLFRTADLSAHVNLDIEFLFDQEYHSPRPASCSYMIGTNGFSAWTGSPEPPRLNSLYFARRVDEKKRFVTKQGVPFHSPNWKSNNSVMISQYDNFPTSVRIPVGKRKCRRMYFLVAGSCQPLSSQMDNALLRVRFVDGSEKLLPINNPKNYWPIWGDFDIQADAFCLPAVPPQRVLIGRNTWANLLDMTVPYKPIASVEFECLVNEIVIGLLGITMY